MTWAIVAKAGIPHVRKEAERLAKYVVSQGMDVICEERLGDAIGMPGAPLPELDAVADLFMTVGGDGTILMTMQHTAKPVFAVNAGAVGFMAEVEPRHARLGIDRVLAGDHEVHERERLRATHNGVELGDAVNEVTFQTSRIAKLVEFTVNVDGEVLDVLRGDGIIVSTPTGSTGYSMSVGGPLLHPRVRGTVLAPIAPFRLAARPWVVPHTAVIELTLLDRDSAEMERPARVVIDGQVSEGVAAGDVVRVEKSDRPARFVRLGHGFYERVRRKLVR